ncbi:hypothetical protein ATO6_12660 [Oceanicola sp. 22II-s10i]|uniref:SDR family NAD(P)-dependent oxidoreductase n=1 Tax=Oceanicola sp. 22II-s10i TaxID=1317116 RepID=UPI000B526737|nr:SDR family oxidoreductase [Oceanicola sp. 22II-s10i]OWU84669.1 hypothetical protein ATO6_12660 [Oceanicola sp. 22II-s10i]
MTGVVITGAASGLGRAAAASFARAGARVMLIDRDEAGLAEVLAALPETAAGPHMAMTVDLVQGAERLTVPEDFGEIDALINNAGISDDSGTLLTDQPFSQLDRLLSLNLRAPAQVFEALSPRFAKGARVVNVASGAALRAVPFRSAYSPSKAGVLGMTRALAAQRPDLTVTALCPGMVRTALVEKLIASGQLDMVRATARIALGRLGQPEDLAEAMVFLASPEAAAMHGGQLCVDGGSSVYGGTYGYAPGGRAALPLDAAAAWSLRNAGPEDEPLAATNAAAPYAAVIDAGPLHSPPGARLEAVHAAASAFAADHPQDASLTLILPPDDPAAPYAAQGDLAGARMLVATLACELGASGRRVNAVQPTGLRLDRDAMEVATFLGGTRAQFVTGQTVPLKRGGT